MKNSFLLEIADKIATRTGDFGVSSVIKKSPPVSNNIFET